MGLRCESGRKAAIAMTTTGLIDPRVHDPAAIRRAAPSLLGLALLDARNTTLAWLAAFDATPQPAALDDLDPPAWLAGHAAWFQERWIARHAQRNRGARCDPRAPPLPSIDPDADDWFDPRASERAWRWSSAAPEPDTVRSYMAATLECTLELLDKTAPDADALHFFRLALHREDRIAEDLAALAQALDLDAQFYPPDWVPPPARARRNPIGIPQQHVSVAPAGDEWRPAIEDGRFDERVPEFEIDAQPVTWAQWAEFAGDGGYHDPRWWSGEGWRWLARVARRAPRYVEQQAAGVSARRQGRLQRLPAAQPVLHVSWYEAQAWCRWAGRRLPAECEWIAAQRSAAARGFVWGDALEWVSDPARLWPGHRPAPAEDDDTVVGGSRMLRGASFAAPRRLRHPGARRFASPQTDAAFVGFRSCAM